MMPDWVWSDADRRWMALALEHAATAGEGGEVPVGAVVVRGDELLAHAGNRRQADGDPSGHAEIAALREAGRRLGDWRLTGCTLYVTLEPCAMCVEACRQARVDLVVWGAADPRGGACGSAVDRTIADPVGGPLAHRGGLEADASRRLLQAFFAKRRDPL
jgi:tRNA(adenine34) deaminase